ncbi:hypothetical protein V6N12_064013 [Hibiscus sabdariffa]|uniref:Dihydrodipicolinate reductase N-terminal domain-containing protein n=1 Tax=Hibiscus sabdariffa TaxID=183260 RepID=A0ABR1ZW08_9ROSI
MHSKGSLFPPPPLQQSLPPRPLFKRYSIHLNAAASSKMGSLLKASSNVFQFDKVPFLSRSKTRQGVGPKRVAFRLAPVASSLSASTGTVQHDQKSNSPDIAIPIMAFGLVCILPTRIATLGWKSLHSLLPRYFYMSICYGEGNGITEAWNLDAVLNFTLLLMLNGYELPLTEKIDYQMTWFNIHPVALVFLHLLQVNGCTGKMGKSVIKAADSAGLHIVPVSFGAEKESGQTVELCGKEILVHGPSERESILASVFQEYPNLVVVDYTVPATVNGNLFGNMHPKLYHFHID